MKKIKLLLRCNKQKPYLLRDLFCGFLTEKNFEVYDDNEKKEDYFLNGKIVVECDFEVEKVWRTTKDSFGNVFKPKYDTWGIGQNQLLEESCLTYEELEKYLNENNGYAIHIKNLNIFDTPKELSDYSKRIGNDFQVLGNAPKNMMKCCEIKYMVEDYILISVSPQEMCRICNGEQTVLLKKRVLKEML